MELRHIYSIAKILNDALETDELVGCDTNDVELKIKVSPSTLFAIDKEFYRQTHNNSTDGFVHNKIIDATINNIHFILSEKSTE